MNSHKNRSIHGMLARRTVGSLLLTALIMSTMTACGKTKEAMATPPTEETETVQPVTEEKNEVTPAPAEDKKNDEVKPTATPKATDAAEDTSEEESSEELTVDMSKVKAFDAPVTMYATKKINIRKGPSTSFESVGMLNAGDPVEVIGQDAGGWYEFKYKNEDAFASNDYLSVDIPIAPDPLAAVADPALVQTAVSAPTPAAQVQAQTVEAAPAPAVTPVVVTAPAGVLIIGDSRCVQMRDVSGGGGCSWICEKAKGYSWFESNALPRADESIGKGTKVVIALGVNDVGNVNSYASMINFKAAEWAARGAKTYFVSVNPVWENPYVTEEQVENFNATLAPQLIGVKWIDTHSYLMSTGYNLVDGMHYDDETNLRVLQVIISKLK